MKYYKQYSKNMNELILCAGHQGYIINFGDWIGFDLLVILRLQEILEEDKDDN